MSQSLGDMLKNRDYSEPPEVQQIKDYVKSELNFDVSVSVKTNSLIIHAPSAGAAGALRPKIYRLQKIIDSKKRIIVRIS